jgi:hypothetical protein
MSVYFHAKAAQKAKSLSHVCTPSVYASFEVEEADTRLAPGCFEP